MFYTARGSHHFERAIREFRNMYEKSQNYIPAEGATWADVWEKTPKMQSDIIRSLILKKENPLYLLRSKEIWGAQKRGKKKTFLAPNSVLLVTDWGFIHAVDEPPVSSQMLSYGVNVRCIPLDALYSIEHFEKEEYGICRHILRLQTGIHPAIMNTEIRFNERANDSVAEFVRAIQEMQGK